MAQNISFEQAVELARSGDPEAQYALSSVLHQRQQFDESLRWLRTSAARGFAPARMTLATLLIDGRHCARDRQQAIDLLQPLAARDAQAHLLLAELHGFAALGGESREKALRHLLSAARLGEPGSMRQLALLAACQQRWDLVRPLQEALARRPSTIDWAALAGSLPQLASPIPLPPPERLHEAPLIRRFPRAIPPLVVKMIIDLAAPLVKRSQIVDAVSGEVRADPMRTSSHVTLGPRQHDHVLEALERCIGGVASVPPLNAEFLQILRYRPGEEFRPHVDYFNESGASAYRSLADGGQRAQTVLIYLNEEYTGGSTAFPSLHIDVKGACGDLLHFHNVDAAGVGHRDSLHAGTPVVTGEKWLLSQWIRQDTYPARLRW
ncbi:MAG: 2OG-Fe(II) oxygenase [Steroidobacteraceae bacterium]